MKPTGKVSVVGAGTVGTAIVYACLIRGSARRMAIYDINGPKARAEVLDLNHGLQFVPPATVEGGDDLEVVRNSDVIVLTAGAKQQPGQSRLDLAAANVALCRELVPQLVELAPEAILLIVTNPVDVVTYAALKVSQLPRERVFGSGTVLDSSRLRFLISQHCGVAVPNVHAYMAGEHGDSELPLWSSARIGSIPLLDWKVPGHGELSAADRARIAAEVTGSAYEIIRGKGATNYAIGLAVARILEAILGDERRVLPVTSFIGGHGRFKGDHPGSHAGIEDVCLALPCVVHRGGAEVPLPLPLSEEEVAGLRTSADTVRAVCRDLGL